MSEALVSEIDVIVDRHKHDISWAPRGNLTRAEVIRRLIIEGIIKNEEEWQNGKDH
jgi:hypothetical protein